MACVPKDRVKVKQKPDWLKTELHKGGESAEVAKIVGENSLHTICESGRCPNKAECWTRRTATFMVMGDICTRACRFCATATGKPLPLDPCEPQRVAHSIALMGLRHAVVTSVTRDDLPDGGAAHWARTIEAIREENPNTTIEILIPDFGGRPELLDIVLAARPDIVGHNIETVKRLTPEIRSRAEYKTSLGVLRYLSDFTTTKSGLMVGLGETKDELLEAMDDLRAAGVGILTIGQYLQPTLDHAPVAEYVNPSVFDDYKREGLARGFSYVASAPLVRSSYMAEEALQTLKFEDWGTVDYADALKKQTELFNALVAGRGAGRVVFCEHPHVYTIGKSGRPENLLVSREVLRERGASFYRTDRGGDVTYHGPGQIVCYPILDLGKLGLGLREYVEALEQSVIETLAEFGIKGERIEGKTGVWVGGGKKICAMGIRASRGVVMHGLALNVDSDTCWFDLINPCGLRDVRTTSVAAELHTGPAMARVKTILREKIIKNIGYDRQKMGCSPPGRHGTCRDSGGRTGHLAGAGQPAGATRCADPRGGRAIF